MEKKKKENELKISNLTEQKVREAKETCFRGNSKVPRFS